MEDDTSDLQPVGVGWMGARYQRKEPGDLFQEVKFFFHGLFSLTHSFLALIREAFTWVCVNYLPFFIGLHGLDATIDHHSQL